MSNEHISQDIETVDKIKKEPKKNSSTEKTKSSDIKIDMRYLKSDPDDHLGIIGELQEKLKEARRKGRFYKTQRDELLAKKNEIPEYIGELGSVEELAKERDEIKTKAIGLQSELTKALSAKEGLEEQIEALTEQIKKHEESTLPDDYAKLQKEYDGLSIRYETVKSTLSKQGVAVNETADSQQTNGAAELERVQQELDFTIKKLAEIGDDLHQTQHKLHQSEVQREDLEQQLTLIKSELEKSETENTRLRTAHDNIFTQLNEVSATSSTYESELETLRHTNEQLQDKVTELTAQLQNASSTKEFVKLSEEKEMLTFEMIALKDQLKNAISVADHNELKRQLNVAKKELERLASTHTALTVEDRKKLVMHDVIKIVNDIQAITLAKHKDIEQEVLNQIQSEEIRNKLIALNEQLEAIK